MRIFVYGKNLQIYVIHENTHYYSIVNNVGKVVAGLSGFNPTSRSYREVNLKYIKLNNMQIFIDTVLHRIYG